MSDSPHSHDFDWVNERDRCSLQTEFHYLMQCVEENCKARRRCAPDNHPYKYEFVQSDSDSFSVRRTDTPLGLCVVDFVLKNDRILVAGSDCEPPWQMALTLTLNDEGLCRFRIDGCGEFMRWQVARRALDRLFFDKS